MCNTFISYHHVDHLEALEINVYCTFTFMHLADAVIQSDLHCIQAYIFLSVHVFPGSLSSEHTHTHTRSSEHTHGAVNTHTEQWTHTRSSEHTHTHGAVNTHTEQWTHTRSSGQPYMLRRTGSSWGSMPCLRAPQSWYWVLDIHPPPTIPAGLRFKPAAFGLRVWLSNH